MQEGQSLRGQSIHHFQHCSHIADSIGASAVPPCRIIDHRRDVVGDHESGKPNLLQRLHHIERIDVPLVDEAFVEAGHRALDVAKVDVDDAAAAAKVADGVNYIVMAVHFGPAAHTEIETVIRAVKTVDRALKPFEIAENSGNAAERFNWGVIRVESKGDAGTLPRPAGAAPGSTRSSPTSRRLRTHARALIRPGHAPSN